MELSIVSDGNTNPPIPEERRKEVRRNDRNAKGNLKDPVDVNTAAVKVPRRRAKTKKKKNSLKGGKRTKCVV